jgi:hypothetical protein
MPHGRIRILAPVGKDREVSAQIVLIPTTEPRAARLPQWL